MAVAKPVNRDATEFDVAAADNVNVAIGGEGRTLVNREEASSRGSTGARANRLHFSSFLLKRRLGEVWADVVWGGVSVQEAHGTVDGCEGLHVSTHVRVLLRVALGVPWRVAVDATEAKAKEYTTVSLALRVILLADFGDLRLLLERGSER